MENVNESKKTENKLAKNICVECGSVMKPEGGCFICMNCGYSPCHI
ncbi:hypothetical protein [Brassicibacter mesophilus]